ncbi:MAG: EAL domain-containing protein [Marinobacter sp.]|uniref:putative bifunctional diguanylate cyclase/phosphodiesterase n=1 Tax=Marinobacter sp. TaxID=50741 RepID=UPI00299E0C18|nr:EAL domain-containing protein [Marinobacter sp.]MDX1756184.1 EAL domain-containing protein [Marinobacter sp.]
MAWFSDSALLQLGITLAKTSVADLDAAIERFLAFTGRAVKAGRGYLFLIDPLTDTLSNTHEWCDHGVESQIDAVQDIPLDTFPWLKHRLRDGTTIHIEDVDALGPEARAEREEFQRQSIQALIMLPIFLEGEVIGFVGYDAVNQPMAIQRKTVDLLKDGALVLGSAVQRKLAFKAHRDLNRSLEKFSGQFPGVLYQFRLYPDGSARFPFISESVRPMFQVAPAELRADATPLLERIDEEDREVFFAEVDRSCQQLQPWHIQFRAKQDSGRQAWIEAKSVPERLADGSTLWHGYFHNITARVMNERQIIEQAQQTRAILDNVADAIVTTDADGLIVTFNRAAERIFGYRADQVIGGSVETLLPEASRGERFRDFLNSWTLTEAAAVNETLALRANGGEFPVELKISQLMLDEQTIYVGVVRDLTERKKAEAEIERLAYYDSLTGLPNRLLFRDRLSQAFASSEREGQHGALVFIDLDDFKTINDSAGHAVGDELLKQVARRLDSTRKRWDTVARLGGDEFVIVLKGFSQDPTRAATQVEKVCERFRAVLNLPYSLSHGEYSGSPSIGIALFLGQQVGVNELLRQADMAMYRAKERGKNRIAFYDSAMQEKVIQRLALESDLRQALVKNEFQLHYQLQVDTGRRPIGVEALVRWFSSERGLVSPGTFIPLAEEIGFIVPLGDWVIQEACRQLSIWKNLPAPFPELVLAVNVSARQFHQQDFVASVVARLEETGAPAERLKLEVTESALVDDLVDVEAKLRRLKAEGVRVSLDDFGTGYSSLGYLKRLPLDELKIDQGFVRDIQNNPGDAAIPRMVIALAYELGLSVVAEGVETAGQLECLRQMGCHRFQGYLFGRPMPAKDLLQLMQPA